MKPTFFLLGFMGCGKSYWSQKLAHQLDLQAIDLDTYIEEVEGRTIATIFAEQGEAIFREIEKQHLRLLPVGESRTIIALGGGTPCFFDNMAYANEIGTTIYLRTSTDILVDRLWHNSENRPLLQGKSKAALRLFIEQKVAERQQYYEQATYIMDVNEETEQQLLAIMKG